MSPVVVTWAEVCWYSCFTVTSSIPGPAHVPTLRGHSPLSFHLSRVNIWDRVLFLIQNVLSNMLFLLAMWLAELRHLWGLPGLGLNLGPQSVKSAKS